MNEIIGQIPQPHVCNPGWEILDGYFHQKYQTIGTVIRCSCGTYWECVPNRYENVLMPEWARIGWFRRWRLAKHGINWEMV